MLQQSRKQGRIKHELGRVAVRSIRGVCDIASEGDVRMPIVVTRWYQNTRRKQRDVQKRVGGVETMNHNLEKLSIKRILSRIMTAKARNVMVVFACSMSLSTVLHAIPIVEVNMAEVSPDVPITPERFDSIVVTERFDENMQVPRLAWNGSTPRQREFGFVAPQRPGIPYHPGLGFGQCTPMCWNPYIQNFVPNPYCLPCQTYYPPSPPANQQFIWR